MRKGYRMIGYLITVAYYCIRVISISALTILSYCTLLVLF